MFHQIGGGHEFIYYQIIDITSLNIDILYMYFFKIV